MSIEWSHHIILVRTICESYHKFAVNINDERKAKRIVCVFASNFEFLCAFDHLRVHASKVTAQRDVQH